jgi:hypothetical protein
VLVVRLNQCETSDGRQSLDIVHQTWKYQAEAELEFVYALVYLIIFDNRYLCRRARRTDFRIHISLLVGEKRHCYCEVCIHVRSSIRHQGPVSFHMDRYYTRTARMSSCLKSGSIRRPFPSGLEVVPLCQNPFSFIRELAVNYNEPNLW